MLESVIAKVYSYHIVKCNYQVILVLVVLSTIQFKFVHLFGFVLLQLK